jgi:3-hydroxyisobutyrate dehydrogenase
MLDAPVSGGVNGAQAGTLTFMVGGDGKDVERARPILSMMGKNIVHCGPSGNGQVAKICNNLVLGVSMIGVAEAMNLGIRLGMDPKKLSDVINSSSGRCWSSDSYNPTPGVLENSPASRDYEGGFASALMAKDLGLARTAARSVKAFLPMANAAEEIYSAQEKNKDFGVVYKFYTQFGANSTKIGGEKH